MLTLFNDLRKLGLLRGLQVTRGASWNTLKNATDSSLIIDAMDLLYTRRFDGFCLVSSDSDFTRLASRLREEGLTVYGFGEEKTPKPFVAACDKFIYIELLREDVVAPTNGEPSTASVAPPDGWLGTFRRAGREHYETTSGF